MSIFEHFDARDSAFEKNLTLIDNLVEGSGFLSGLSRDAGSIADVTTNVVNKSTLFTDLISGGPDETQLIPGCLDNFARIVAQISADTEGGLKKLDPDIQKMFWKATASYGPYVIQKTSALLDTDEFDEAIATTAKDEIIGVDVVKDLIINETDAYIALMIRASYETGLLENPFFSRMLALFQAGGLPCGWVGVEPTVENMNEQSVVECMQVFHLG